MRMEAVIKIGDVLNLNLDSYIMSEGDLKVAKALRSSLAINKEGKSEAKILMEELQQNLVMQAVDFSESRSILKMIKTEVY
jgi:transcriptional regulatory protein LevR